MAFEPWLGQRIGPWTLERFINEGSFGQVFYARSNSTAPEEVAIKVLNYLGGDALSRWKKEITALKKFRDYPHIISYIADGTIQPPLHSPLSATHYLVMEYAEASLAEMHPLDADLRVLLLGWVEGLVALHAQGYAHRDVKPANLLVADGVAVLGDFGLVRSGRELYETQPLLTRRYASPEVLRSHRQQPADDIWALGITVAEKLGCVSLDISTTNAAEKRQRICAEISQHWRPIVYACLSPERQRITAEELLAALGGKELPERCRPLPATLPYPISPKESVQPRTMEQPVKENVPLKGRTPGRPLQPATRRTPLSPRDKPRGKTRRAMLLTSLGVGVGAIVAAGQWGRLPLGGGQSGPGYTTVAGAVLDAAFTDDDKQIKLLIMYPQSTANLDKGPPYPPFPMELVYLDVATLKVVSRASVGFALPNNRAAHEAALSPDGRWLVTSYADHGEPGLCRLWRFGKKRHVAEYPFTASAIAFAPDSSQLILAPYMVRPTRKDGEPTYAFALKLNRVRLDRPQRLETLPSVLGFQVAAMALSPDNKRLVSWNSSSSLDLHDVETGKRLKAVNADAHGQSISFTADGSHFVAEYESGIGFFANKPVADPDTYQDPDMYHNADWSMECTVTALSKRGDKIFIGVGGRAAGDFEKSYCKLLTL